jgi:hypothetical protein
MAYYTTSMRALHSYIIPLWNKGYHGRKLKAKIQHVDRGYQYRNGLEYGKQFQGDGHESTLVAFESFKS